ncbi:MULTISPECIES: DUF1501 domain-containing protein [unclassified Schlesneria]|uniref:DUF1501 domain-containing protein n=1 Tax=unclassified Schlesneria TaxID=2762017 RepID=UPI002F043B1A
MRLFAGAGRRFCDKISRRSFVQMGSLAVGGLTLPGLLRAEHSRGTERSHKAVIMVYLSGGLPHQDTFDLKPNAPAEIRGEFSPIPSSLPGLDVCELMPKLATVMDRCAIIRSVVGQRDEHSSFQNLTGYTMGETQRNHYPNFGSFVSKIKGPSSPLIPPFVDLFPTMQHRPYNSTGAGSLGSQYHQTRADGEDLASMKLRYIESAQFNSRQKLLEGLDAFRREADRSGMNDLDQSYQRAFEVLTSSRLLDALDVEKEDPKTRARYALGSSKHQGDGAPLWNDQLLIARRLVEAGVRVVTVAYGFWDTHGNNFGHCRNNLPVVDAGLSALVEDIYQRGLADDVSLVVWGEFGRTPKINKDAGRDHWAPVQSVLMSGGGMQVGQVIGSTDKTAAYAESRPVHYRDVLATIYHNLGIDPHEFVRDINERPIPVMPDDARPIRELIG